MTGASQLGTRLAGRCVRFVQYSRRLRELAGVKRCEMIWRHFAPGK